MANKYVRSTDGSNTDDGSTWALAKANLKDMATAAAAGDSIFLSQAHSEANAASTTITLPGTVTNPCRVIASDDGAEPPTSVAAAIVGTTGANNLILAGSAYFNGITFNGGNAAQNYLVMFVNYSVSVNAIQTYENCTFNLVDTHPSSEIRIGSDGGIVTDTYLYGCSFKLSSVDQFFRLRSKVRIVGGSFIAGSSTPTVGLISLHGSGVPTIVSIEDFDFSNLAATLKLFNTPSSGTPAFVKLRNCKLPAGWSGSLVGGAFSTPNSRYEMWNCDAGNKNYKLWVETPAGSVRDETVVVATGGASDGTTAYSMKMATNANAKVHGYRLDSPELLTWVDSVGSSLTATVEVVHDSATALTDADIYLELDYMGSSANPMGTMIADKPASVLTTPVAQTASSAAWTTTGLSTPNKQKLSVTFTPQQKGYVQARVVLTAASKTVFVDPKLTVA